MSTVVNKTQLALVMGDITEQASDAIVNAANPTLMGGGGVDGAIHRVGGPVILEECKAIRGRLGTLLPTGGAVITSGGNLKAKHVIHTVGPIWHDGKRGEPGLLGDAYRNSLTLAAKEGMASIAFPSISTGAYGYPVEQAARVAVRAVVDFLKDHAELGRVVFVLHDRQTLEVYEDALKKVMGEV